MGITSTHKVFINEGVNSTNEYYSIKAPNLIADEDGIYEFD